MHEYEVRPFYVDYLAYAGENARRNLIERLVWLHNIQIMMRNDVEKLENLIQHLPVLRSDTDPDVKTTALGELSNNGCHLDSFGARPENCQNLFHQLQILVKSSHCRHLARRS